MLSFSCICRRVLDTSSIQPGHLGPRCSGDLMWFVGLSDQNYVGFKWISAIVPWRQLEGAKLFRCHSRGCRKVGSDSFETRLYSMLLTCITPSQEYQPITIINIIMPSICQVGIQEQCEHTSHSSQSQPAIKTRTSHLNPGTSRDKHLGDTTETPLRHHPGQDTTKTRPKNHQETTDRDT